ncbi:NAD(P)-dependent oxidoreductase [Piscinibacter gummiphilus]|uniref:NAD(P)-dependent oxidoreductase n=1 Tax=Piscinibacter gummiphilus TaxID=946333 RepID=A0ABZ0D135_9BURK|nr:NAD(P)-dependent oxidoreductase [Piscinibacter gummiphilus]WOB10898.1 NAD(P)-dependent oxidoreductase [Piscinibacter gummiphilus]
MNATPGESVSPEPPAAGSPPGALRVLFLDVAADDQAMLEALCPRLWWSRFAHDTQVDENDGAAALAQVLCVFVRTPVTRELLQRMPALQLVATRSAGVDHVDLDACRERNIAVVHVPDYGAATVAEHTFALLLALARHLFEARARALRGSFSYRGLTGFELEGKVLGVVGCGRIGTHVARIARGFGMKVLAFDPRPEVAISLGIDLVGWSELLERSDILSLHVPLTPETHHLLDDNAFARIKPGVVLLNTARGGLIDEEALLRALDRGAVSAAGLDVLEHEGGTSPEAPMGCEGLGCDRGWETSHPLLSHPRVLATPHVGFNTREAVARILHETIDNIAAWQAGQTRHRVP